MERGCSRRWIRRKVVMETVDHHGSPDRIGGCQEAGAAFAEV